MKQILLNGLIVGAIAGIVNAALAFALGGSVLETPYAAPSVTELTPVSQFAMIAGIMTLILTLLGAVILGLLYNRFSQRGVKIWTYVGIAFLVLYGLLPFVAPGIASTQAAILVNILHLVAGIPALYFIPRKSNLI